MNKKQKGCLIAAGTVVAGLALFEGLRRKGKDYFHQAFSTKRKAAEAGCWLEKMPHETIHLMSHDGLKLQGYYVSRPNAAFTFVILHGYHGNAFRMSQYAKTFYETFPCNLFLPDLRGHGQSEGNLVGYGWLDREDVKDWVSLLHQRQPDQPIVLFGLSMGGGTVNFLADQALPGVQALVEDCGYSTLYRELDYQCRKRKHVPLWPFYWGLNSEIKKKAGYRILEADGLKAVSRAKYPMLFIHGLDDEVVPSQMVFDLYNACTSEKQLFFVKNTGHGDALKNSPRAYLETLHEFLSENLSINKQ